MEKSDVERLFSLLECYYPNASQLKNKRVQAAWCMAMEPYDYEAVKAAAVAYARRNKFFPDVADILSGLPEPAKDVAVDVRQKDNSMLPYIRQGDEQDAVRMAARPAMAMALHLVGLKTWPEAKSDGMTWEDWVADYDAKRDLLPPGWGALKAKGLAYPESVPVMERNWAEFWASHGEKDLGVP